VILLEAEGLVALLLVCFWIWALFDSISTDAARCRNLPKVLWILLVVVLFDLGALAWLLLGRPQRAGRRPGSTDYSKPSHAVGPEDHPTYSVTPEITDRRSKELDRQLDEWERRRRGRDLDVD
jgi:hypothetical protein